MSHHGIRNILAGCDRLCSVSRWPLREAGQRVGTGDRDCRYPARCKGARQELNPNDHRDVERVRDSSARSILPAFRVSGLRRRQSLADPPAAPDIE
jgi:hypothetical protein